MASTASSSIWRPSAARRRDIALHQAHRHTPLLRRWRDLASDTFDGLDRQHHRGDAVSKTVGLKNRAERFGQDSSKAILRQRPCRVLAARAAAKVEARHEDPRARVGGIVEYEGRVWIAAADLAVTPTRE